MLKNMDYATTCFISSLSSDDVKVSFCPFNFLCKSFQLLLIYRDVFFPKYSRPLTSIYSQATLKVQKYNILTRHRIKMLQGWCVGKSHLGSGGGVVLYTVEIHISHVVGCKVWVWINHFPPNFKKWGHYERLGWPVCCALHPQPRKDLKREKGAKASWVREWIGLERDWGGSSLGWEQKNIQDLGAFVQMYLITLEVSNTYLNMALIVSTSWPL